MSLAVASRSASVSASYWVKALSGQPTSRARARRSIPSSDNTKPVEKSGSTNPAAIGNCAHRGPTHRAVRKARGSAHTHGRRSLAGANWRPMEGNRSRKRRQASAGSIMGGWSRFATSAKPALVTPLLKRSTHIHPPSKVWCRAASSGGKGAPMKTGLSWAQEPTPVKCENCARVRGKSSN